MDRKIKFSLGEYYHIYNRGVEKRKIFLEKNDYTRFTKMLRLANGEKPVVFRLVQGMPLDKVDVGERVTAIGAYVLMPNHFHILARETKENGLSSFMEKLTTSYSMYFNKKYERVGSLFQGRFKAEHIDSDEYLKYLLSYTHLNPIKLYQPSWKEEGLYDSKQAEKFLNQYQYSSYLDYVEKYRTEKVILSLDKFPKYFDNKSTFVAFHNDWLSFNTRDYTRDALV